MPCSECKNAMTKCNHCGNVFGQAHKTILAEKESLIESLSQQLTEANSLKEYAIESNRINAERAEKAEQESSAFHNSWLLTEKKVASLRGIIDVIVNAYPQIEDLVYKELQAIKESDS